MRKTIPTSLVLPFLTLLFFVFPYTQIIPLSSYTQPYGLAFAMMIVILRPRAIRALPQLDRVMLVSLACLGLILLLVEIPWGLDFREITGSLSYVNPLFSTAAAFWIVQRYPSMTRKMLIAAILAWFGVSLIQTLILPTFLTQLVTSNLELADNIRASGRGALGLAPEPTHNGFHSLLLAAALALAGGPTWVIMLAVLNALILAKSASSVLALAIGSLLWALNRPLRRFWVFMPIFVLPAAVAILAAVVGEDSRLGGIISKIEYYGPSIVMLDYSINARISGATTPILFSFSEFLMPQGISIQRWYEVRDILLADYPWVMDLSLIGPATGTGLFLFQCGFLAVPFVLYFGYRLIVQADQSGLMGIAGAVAFAIFLGQFYFATPTLGLFLAILIMRVRSKHTSRVGVMQNENSPPITACAYPGGLPDATRNPLPPP